MKNVAASIPLIALVALLVGCGPTPDPAETPAADPRPTPTGSPTAVPVPTPTETLPPEVLEPLDTVTRLVLLTDEVSFCDDTVCGIDSFSFDGPHELAAAKLSTVFGVDPTVEYYAHEEGGEAYYYSWPDVVLFYVVGEGQIGPNLGVSITVPELYGVTFETEHGVRVGMPMAEAAPLADSAGNQWGEYEAKFDTIALDEHQILFVGAYSDADGAGPVLSITGPIWESSL